MKFNTKKLAIMGMLSAMAYILTVFIRIPLLPQAPFLNYDVKDVIIAIGGFLYGPLSAFILSVTVSLLELVSVSDTGLIGFVMNVVSTCAFVLPAAIIYKRNKTIKTAILGLVSGVVCMCIVMVAWNYFLTPLYMGTPRPVVAAMLPTVFLPFNLIKGILNAMLIFVLYKPIVRVLRNIRFYQ